MIDYHIHTKLCGHASGEMEEYVEYAISSGLKEMGFSDHMPMATHQGSGLAMQMDQLPGYVDKVLELDEKYKEINIKLGIEVDYFPGLEDISKEIIERYSFDYVIGSVHFIEKWGFDNINQIDQWDKKNINKVYRDYYSLLRKSAISGLYDIIGHSDLVKKFGQRPDEDMSEEIEHTAQIFKENNLVIEINTSGLRRPVKEMYPSEDVLMIYSKFDIPLVIGSDAHKPQDVGMDFNKALQLAGNAGYFEETLFDKRQQISKRSFK